MKKKKIMKKHVKRSSSPPSAPDTPWHQPSEREQIVFASHLVRTRSSELDDLWCKLTELKTAMCGWWRLIQSCVTQLKAQGPSRTCTESKEKVKGHDRRHVQRSVLLAALKVVHAHDPSWFGVWGLRFGVEGLGFAE